jgi:hypothetical protein
LGQLSEMQAAVSKPGYQIIQEIGEGKGFRLPGKPAGSIIQACFFLGYFNNFGVQVWAK